MKNDKGQTAKKNDETVASEQERLLGSYVPTGRVNINDINKRNAEQEKQEKKSSYTVTGIAALSIVLIVVAIYFFS